MSRWSLVLIPMLLGGCGSLPRDEPAPVESRNLSVQTDATNPADGAQVQAYRPPAALPSVAAARPQPARAVQVLLQRADDQRRAGDLPAAAVSLERGLRIDPANATLWNRLAHVHAAQRQYDRVEQLAAKSNSLAGGDDVLTADNWGLIAQAREALGDSSGAARARIRASVHR